MGGIACLIPWNAKVTFDEFPENANHHQFKELEQQIRDVLLASPAVNESIEARGYGMEVCELLERPNLSVDELRHLYTMAKPPY